LRRTSTIDARRPSATAPRLDSAATLALVTIDAFSSALAAKSL
jgi:hypothetical protein